MAKKLTKSITKKIKRYEKDIKEDQKLWSSIEKIHKQDENILSRFKDLLKKEPRNSTPKKRARK